MSVEAFGTVAGVQFEAVFQSPLLGLRFHVAFPARVSIAESKSMPSNVPSDQTLKSGKRRQASDEVTGFIFFEVLPADTAGSLLPAFSACRKA